MTFSGSVAPENKILDWNDPNLKYILYSHPVRSLYGRIILSAKFCGGQFINAFDVQNCDKQAKGMILNADCSIVGGHLICDELILPVFDM